LNAYGYNNGRFDDVQLNRLIDAAADEINADKRMRLISDPLTRSYEQFYYLPIHRQMLTWASRANVRSVIAPSNNVNVR
jgi:peptide/nickel transport system substrate-binding protein